MSASIFTVVKASVLILVLIPAIVIYSGLAPSHSWPCWSVTLAMLILSSWALWSAPMSTTSVRLYPHCQQLWQQPPCFSVPSGFWWHVGHHCSYSVAASSLYGHNQNTQNPWQGMRICLVHVILCSYHMHAVQYW